MKAQIRMIIASVIVIALALTAVSGITYSWFSDTEQSKIEVITAVVDFEPTYTLSTGSDTATSAIGTTLTKGALTGGIQAFTLENLAANQQFTIISDIDNKSTVKTVYRMYATWEKATGANITDYDIQNISINGKYLTTTEGTSDSPSVIITNWTELAVGTDPTPTNITIATPTTYGDKNSDGTWVLPGTTTGYAAADWDTKTARSGLTINIVIQAYQGDYPYTAMTTETINSQEVSAAVIPANKVVEASSIVTSDTSSATATNVVMDFSDAGTYKESGTGDAKEITGTKVTAKVTEVDTASSKVTIDLNLYKVTETSGSTTNELIDSPTFTNPVVITMTVPGKLTEPKITYNGAQDGKILSSTINGDNTTVVFSVDHFSEYVIADTVVTTAEGLQASLNAGGYVKLGATITVNTESDKSGTAFISKVPGTVLDLNGYTISTNMKCLIDVQDTLTIRNGDLVCTYGQNSSEKEGRVINIDGDSVDDGGSGAAENMTLTLRDVDVIGPTDNSFNRGITVWGTKNLTIEIDGGSISANHYPLNIVSGNTGITCTVKNAILEGYCAFQTRSPGSYTFKGCVLSGVNQWTGVSDRFGVIVLESEASNPIVTLKDCLIKAVEKTDNELFLSLKCSSKLYSVTIEGCEYSLNDVSISLETIKSNLGTLNNEYVSACTISGNYAFPYSLTWNYDTENDKLTITGPVTS